MKLFAVILASVAVIISSVQAFLLWKQSERIGGDFASEYVEARRNYACVRLLQGTAKIEAFSEKSETILQLAQEDKLARPTRYRLKDTTDEERLKDAVEYARREFLTIVDDAAGEVIEIRDAYYAYFSENELNEMEFNRLAALPAEFSPKFGSNLGYAEFIADESEFNRVLSSLAEIGKLNSKVQDVCRPIMAGN